MMAADETSRLYIKSQLQQGIDKPMMIPTIEKTGQARTTVLSIDGSAKGAIKAMGELVADLNKAQDNARYAFAATANVLAELNIDAEKIQRGLYRAGIKAKTVTVRSTGKVTPVGTEVEISGVVDFDPAILHRSLWRRAAFCFGDMLAGWALANALDREMKYDDE